MRAKMMAWVSATMLGEDLGGKRKRIPGVNTKKSTTRMINIMIFIFRRRLGWVVLGCAGLYYRWIKKIAGHGP
jgi:hypothetical protein